MLSATQEISTSVTSAIAGSLSSAASATIIVMILRSPTKLSSPFRRIIFGMSVYDVFQSISALLSLFLSPAGEKWGAFGNDGTCAFSGFFFQLGTLGSPLYSLFLSFFYLCAIRFSVTNERFRRKYEIIFHTVINCVVWVSSIYLASAGYMNFSDTNCWIGPYPRDCVHNEEIDCIRGERAFLLQWIFAGYPILFTFFGNIGTLFVLVYSMFKLQWKLNSLRNSWRRPDEEKPNLLRRVSRKLSSLASSIVSSGSVQNPNLDNNVNHPQNSHYTIPRRSVTSSNSRRSSIINQNNTERDLIKQAILYTAAFLLVYSFSFIYRITLQMSDNGAPFFILFLARVLNPLQGVFNVLIYTRIRVSSLRANSNYSWIKAFWIVISSGGDHDTGTAGNGSNQNGAPLVGRSFNPITPPSHLPQQFPKKKREVVFEELKFPVGEDSNSRNLEELIFDNEAELNNIGDDDSLRDSEMEMILQACDKTCDKVFDSNNNQKNTAHEIENKRNSIISVLSTI